MQTNIVVSIAAMTACKSVRYNNYRTSRGNTEINQRNVMQLVLSFLPLPSKSRWLKSTTVQGILLRITLLYH